MIALRATFRGLATDMHPGGLPSGSAAVSRNVVIDGNRLRARPGFSQLSLDTPGGGILNLTTAAFADGSIWLVAKNDEGELHAKRLHPQVGTWTLIEDKYDGHSADDRGWFYFWMDRLFYFDRVGGTKWHPTAGTWKAGVASTTGALMQAAAGGRKEGLYYVHVAKRNSLTGEISVTAGPQSTPCETRESEEFGGISILNWSNIEGDTSDAKHEWDEAVFYCTVAEASDYPSFRAYLDAIIDDDASSAGLSKPDCALEPRPFTNAGGLPPGARQGCFNGVRAVYLDIYDDGDAVPGRVDFSLPGYPAMVPRERKYTWTNGAKTFFPRPFTGVLHSGIPGVVTGCGAVGERFLVFTASGAHWLVPAPDGRLYPIQASAVHGCPSEGGAVQTPRAVHALGAKRWLRADPGGLVDVSADRFRNSLPADASGAVAGYFSARDEVWVALGTEILIYDDARGELVGTFAPASLGQGTVAALCEYGPPDGTPVMLAGLTDGRVLVYDPAGEDRTDQGLPFACAWAGWYGQERRASPQALDRLWLHVPRNPGGLTLGLAGVRSPEELGADPSVVPAAAAASKAVSGEGRIDVSGAEFSDAGMGNMFRLTIESTTEQEGGWEVADLVMLLA